MKREHCLGDANATSSQGAADGALRNAEIDAHPLLDQDQRSMCKVMRTRSRRDGVTFTLYDFARIALQATAKDYADVDLRTDGNRLCAVRDLQRAALLFVYEALKACDHDIIKQWPEFDTMLQQLEDLGALGLPQ